jgi:FPG/IleRS zinc finger protein
MTSREGIGMKDSDLLPLTCPRCGHKFEEEIGTLNARNEVICPKCATPLTFDRQAVVDLIKDVAGAFQRFNRSLRA